MTHTTIPHSRALDNLRVPALLWQSQTSISRDVREGGENPPLPRNCNRHVIRREKVTA
jgi:hypothetical protein